MERKKKAAKPIQSLSSSLFSTLRQFQLAYNLTRLQIKADSKNGLEQLKTFWTHKLKTYKPVNPKTYKLIISKTYNLINPKTYKPINPKTYKLISPKNYKLINSKT